MAEPSRKGPGGKGERKTARDQRGAGTGGGIVKIFAATIVLGVVAGLGYVNLDKIKGFVSARNKPAPLAPIAKPEQPPEETKPVVIPAAPIAKPAEVDKSKPVIPNAPIAKITLEDEAVQKLIDEGRAALNKMDFAGAVKLLANAKAKKAGSAISAEARAWHAKAAAFETATRHIPISDFASAETTYIISTVGGGERRGLIKSETPEMVEFQEVSSTNPASLGRQILPIPVIDITSKEPVSLSMRRQEFQQLLHGLESGAAFNRSADFYDLVYLSKRLGLATECVGYLGRAYSGGDGHAADPDLGDSFRKEVIRRTIDWCSIMLASGQPKHRVESKLKDLVKKELPGYEVAVDEANAFRMSVLSKVKDDFKPTLRKIDKPVAVAAAKSKDKNAEAPVRNAKQLANEEENIEFVVESGGVQGKGAAQPIVEKANAKYEEGLKKYKTFKLGTNGNNNRILDEARTLLEDAVNLYDAALQKDPTNKSVLDRQTEANMIVYACRKYHTL